MKKQEIIKGNRIIAGFMMKDGKLQTPTMIYTCNKKNPTIDEITEVSDFFDYMEYQSSWDWLMPVIEKVCKTEIGDKRQVIFDLYPSSESAFLQVRQQENMLSYPIVRYYPEEHNDISYIQQAYEAVIEFIKWYNEQQLTNPKKTYRTRKQCVYHVNGTMSKNRCNHIDRQIPKAMVYTKCIGVNCNYYKTH